MLVQGTVREWVKIIATAPQQAERDRKLFETFMDLQDSEKVLIIRVTVYVSICMYVQYTCVRVCMCMHICRPVSVCGFVIGCLFPTLD